MFNPNNIMTIKEFLNRSKTNHQIEQQNLLQNFIERLNESIIPLEETLDKLNINMDKLNPLNTLTEKLEPIAEVCNMILHPTILLSKLWDFAVDISFWVVCLGSVFCVIMMACGHSKAKKWIPTGFVVYTLIQAIDGVI